VRRALALALAAALLCALPAAASAQEAASEGTPVVGGGSFLAAPLLENGSYTDTLLPGERLYYGVELQPGQRLRVAGELDVDAGKYDAYADGFSLGVQTPLREVDVLDAVGEDITGNSSVTVDLDDRLEYVTPAVLTKSAAHEDVGVYRGPGTWYVSLYLTTSDDRPRRIEFPVQLEVEVIGEPEEDPAPEPTPAPPAEEEAPEGEESDGGDGTSLAAVLGIGAAGLAVGLVGGAAAGLRGRRRA
jgi:Ca-activated chloride channel family protein